VLVAYKLKKCLEHAEDEARRMCDVVELKVLMLVEQQSTIVRLMEEMVAHTLLWQQFEKTLALARNQAKKAKQVVVIANAKVDALALEGAQVRGEFSFLQVRVEEEKDCNTCA